MIVLVCPLPCVQAGHKVTMLRNQAGGIHHGYLCACAPPIGFLVTMRCTYNEAEAAI